MKEGAKSLAQLHAERKLFVEQAMQEGALSEMHRKKVDIGLMYTFNDELTLNDIATQVYPQDKSGRANVSLQFRGERGFIKTLSKRVSYTLSSKYEIEDLLTRKPMSQKSRERKSKSHGGKTLEIRDLILRGTRSVDELEQQSRLSRQSIWQALRVLEGWGVDVSQFAGAVRENREKIEQLIKEDDDKKIQRIFDELSGGVILRDAVEYKKRKNPRVFTTIGRTASDIYHYEATKTHLFAKDLEENEIPNRIIKIPIKGGKPLVYYVFLEKHKDRALAVWEKDPRLERFKTNPVSIVCGNNMDIPTASQLLRGKNYRSVSSVLLDLGIRIHPLHQREFKKWLFEGCPITVWAYRSSRHRVFRIPLSQVGQFKQYFLEKSA